jgi:hypothetical protein
MAPGAIWDPGFSQNTNAFNRQIAPLIFVEAFERIFGTKNDNRENRLATVGFRP